jgi:hypothetical protein
MSLNVGQLIQERDELKKQIENVPKIRSRIMLLNKLIALEDPLRADVTKARNGAGEINPDNVCDVCQAGPFRGRNGLGMHKQKLHGISGSTKGGSRRRKL